MQVLDKGHLELVMSCANDLDVVNGARVSFNEESDELTNRDKGLIKFLMRERHGTPFEQGYFKFRVKAPLFVFREWHRHRIGHSYNEWSARYSELKPEFYVPNVDNVVTQVGKPGHYTFEPLPEISRAMTFVDEVKINSEACYALYRQALESGIAKQQARIFLPVNIYSEMIWSCNPRSLMHFLSLRNSDQAQAEIRDYAQVAERIFFDTMPITAQAFIENKRLAP